MTKTLRERVMKIIEFRCFEDCADINASLATNDILKLIKKELPIIEVENDTDFERGFNTCLKIVKKLLK